MFLLNLSVKADNFGVPYLWLQRDVYDKLVDAFIKIIQE